MRTYVACILFAAACSASPSSMDAGADLAGSDAMDAGSVMFESTSFVLMPGEEVFKCQDFANPFGGVDTDVQSWESHMTPGSHHMLLFYQDNAKDIPLADCPALQFQALPYGAQTPDNVITYPAGIAAKLKGTQGFHMQMHYLNASASPVTVQIKMVLHKAAPGTVTQHAGVFFLNNVTGIHTAPGATETITASYTFPKPVKLLYATGHLHKFDNNLIATMNGQEIFKTESWDNTPFQKYEPEIDVAAGTTITWSCDVNNTTTGILTFGESALTNNMCIFDGQYYPAPETGNPTIEATK
jgi:hypothetical protein